MKTLILLITQIIFLFPYLIHSQSEALDITFGNNGIVQTDVGGDLDVVHTILLQPDGKILVAGISQIPGNFGDVAVVRYHSDGTLDESFGVNGKMIFAIGTLSDYAIVLALQPDGKILIGGYYGVNSGNFLDWDITDSYLARLNSNGSIDETFGEFGFVKMDYNKKENRLYDIHLQDDGKIITIQSFKSALPGVSLSGYLLTRFDTNGAVDSTFGNQGTVSDTLFNESIFEYQISFQSDDKYLLATNHKTDTSSHIILRRYNINGTIDRTFGNSGSTISTFENYKDHFNKLLLQPDGKIFIIGYTYSAPGMADLRTLLLRYNKEGKVDSTFGANGRLLTPYEEYNNNPVFISNDKILVAGGAGFPVLRFHADGTLDESFGYNGQIKLSEEIGYGRAIAIQPDGKIVVAGTSPVLNEEISTVDFLIIRYLTDFSVGVKNLKNSLRDVNIYPNPIAETAIFEFTLSQQTHLSMALHDQTGKCLQQFLKNESRTAGMHREILYLNKDLPKGIYFITLTTGLGQISWKVFK